MSRRLNDCYLCGERAETTRDHVIPRSLLPEPLPNGINLITAPACSNCHTQDLREDEELFRAFVAAGSYDNYAGRSTWAQGVRLSFERDDGDGFRQRVARHLQTVELRSPSGLVHPNKAAALVISGPESDRITRVLAKVILGLHYHHNNKTPLIGATVYVRQAFVGEPGTHALMQSLNFEGRFGDPLAYWYGIDRDEPSLSWWGLVFYRTMLFLAFTSPHKNAATVGTRPWRVIVDGPERTRPY